MEDMEAEVAVHPQTLAVVPDIHQEAVAQPLQKMAQEGFLAKYLLEAVLIYPVLMEQSH